MESIDAEVLKDEDNEHYIQINANPVIRIPISTDDANAVKKAFCQLVNRLRVSCINIELKEPQKKDLFYFVAYEYISLLNQEVGEIYQDIEANGLLVEADEADEAGE